MSVARRFIDALLPWALIVALVRVVGRWATGLLAALKGWAAC